MWKQLDWSAPHNEIEIFITMNERHRSTPCTHTHLHSRITMRVAATYFQEYCFMCCCGAVKTRAQRHSMLQRLFINEFTMKIVRNKRSNQAPQAHREPHRRVQRSFHERTNVCIHERREKKPLITCFEARNICFFPASLIFILMIALLRTIRGEKKRVEYTCAE